MTVSDTFDHTRHVTDVLAAAPAAIERTTWDAERIRALQTERLRGLLAHAVEHSPFHRERLGRIDLDRITPEDLRDLPVMTKAEMMASFDDVVTDRRLTREVVDAQVAAAPQHLTHLLGRYLVMGSGGSSGTRGVFVYDAPEFTEFTLGIIRSTLATLAALGVTPEAPIPGAPVAAGATVHGTGAVGALAGSDGAPVRMARIPATEPIGSIVARLQQVQPLVLVGYPSVLVRLAAEKAAGHLDIAPLAVGSTSEPLDPRARMEIEGAFGVPMTDTFGSSEGLCGVSAPGERAIAFATDFCIVELVDEDRRPVEAGTVAATALITNLYNRTQPLIRYELTDRFVEVLGPHPDGRLRAVVDGRHDDPFRYGDVVVHPLAVRSVLLREPGVFEHQVRQTDAGIDVVLVATPEVDLPSVERALRDALGAAGLPQPEVRVSRAHAVERDGTTGKARRFIPA